MDETEIALLALGVIVTVVVLVGITTGCWPDLGDMLDDVFDDWE